MGWDSLLGNASSYLNPSTVQTSGVQDNNVTPAYNISMDVEEPVEATMDFSTENFADLNKQFKGDWQEGGSPLPYNEKLKLYQESWNKNNPNLTQLDVDGRYGAQMDTHFRGLQYPDNELVTDATGINVANPILAPEEAQKPVEEAGSGLLGAAKKPWKFQGWDYNRFKGF